MQHKSNITYWKYKSSHHQQSNRTPVSKFHFNAPMNISWKSKSRNHSNEEISDLSDTCIYNEETAPTSLLKNSEDHSEKSSKFIENLKYENYELTAEVKKLKSELSELKTVVKELQQFKNEYLLRNSQEIRSFQESESSIFKKGVRPPLPYHRRTNSADQNT